VTPRHHTTTQQTGHGSSGPRGLAGAADLPDAAKPRPDWVPETAFGRWFLSTTIWRDYVLNPAVQQLAMLAGARFPLEAHLLDLGCGAAASIPLLVKTFRPDHITALDIDPAALETARRKHGAASDALGVRTTFTQASATRLPLSDASIDAVFCHQLLHHLYRQRAALREIRRVLRPGGLLMLAESCRPFIETLPVRLLFRHPKGVQREATDYARAVSQAGLSVQEDDVLTTRPWWSTYDLGVTERLVSLHDYRPIKARPTELLLVAQRPPK